MSLPRFRAAACSYLSDYEAKVIDTTSVVRKGLAPSNFESVCFCADMKTAEIIARALNREMMQ